VSFPERLPLQSVAPYPEGATRACFADPRPSRRAWCLDPSLQEADRGLASAAGTFVYRSRRTSTRSASSIPTARAESLAARGDISTAPPSPAARGVPSATSNG
jgi:hypothetical protein